MKKKLFMNVLMRKSVSALVFLLLPLMAMGQVNTKESCTSIMVGKRASTDGSVITSHTCDGRYRTWMTVEPAANHKKGDKHLVKKGTMHTVSPSDTTLLGTNTSTRESQL